MLRRIHLHGPFAAFHDGPIEIVADTVFEAVEAVTMQLAGFAPAGGERKAIKVVGYNSVDAMKVWDDDTQDIHILPAIFFGKSGGLIQTVVGAVLFVASFIPGLQFLAPIGISMMIGGVMQMLAPQPQLNSNNEEQQRSKYLPGIQNTVAIGTTIPLLYGHYRVGGHLLSLNIDAKTDVGV